MLLRLLTVAATSSCKVQCSTRKRTHTHTRTMVEGRGTNTYESHYKQASEVEEPMSSSQKTT